MTAVDVHRFSERARDQRTAPSAVAVRPSGAPPEGEVAGPLPEPDVAWCESRVATPALWWLAALFAVAVVWVGLIAGSPMHHPRVPAWWDCGETGEVCDRESGNQLAWFFGPMALFAVWAWIALDLPRPWGDRHRDRTSGGVEQVGIEWRDR